MLAAALCYFIADTKRLGDAAMHNRSARPMPETPFIIADSALRESLSSTLGIAAARAARFTDETPMLGTLPELDSLAVATLLTDFEDRLDIRIDDDDVDAGTFETFGTMRAFLIGKIAVTQR
jgi:acyl carrier protein